MILSLRKILASLSILVAAACITARPPAVGTADLSANMRDILERDIQPQCWQKEGGAPYQLNLDLYECKREAQYFTMFNESDAANVLPQFRHCMTARGWQFQQSCSARPQASSANQQ